MAEINTADIEKSNKLLETQKELISKISSAMGALKRVYKDSLDSQKAAMNEAVKGAESQKKATELQTKALEKQKAAVEQSKAKLEEWAAKGEQSLKKLQSGMSGLGKGIAAIGGPLVTGALGMLGGGLAGMLKENEALKASLKSVQTSLQGAFAPIAEAVLPLVDTFAQSIANVAQAAAPFVNSFVQMIGSLVQTVTPLLNGVMGGIGEALSGVDLSGLLTPLTAGLDGILALFSKLGQATGTWMQGLDLSGLAGSFAGLVSAHRAGDQTLRGCRSAGKKARKETHRKRDGRGRQDKAKGGDAYGRGGVKRKSPLWNKGGGKRREGDSHKPSSCFFFASNSSWVITPASRSSL